MTMTRDPDLDQAIVDLEFTALRIRQLEEQIIRADDLKEYQILAQRRHELADRKNEIATRAERLSLDPRALLLLVEQANRLRRRFRRRPTVAQIETLLMTAADIAERDQTEAAANLALARDQLAHVTTRVRSIEAARAYMEASR